jgi:hypothetical protein
VIFAEASVFDKIWGIGLASDDDMATSPKKWPGRNLLGKTLNRLKLVLQTPGSGLEDLVYEEHLAVFEGLWL